MFRNPVQVSISRVTFLKPISLRKLLDDQTCHMLDSSFKNRETRPGTEVHYKVNLAST